MDTINRSRAEGAVMSEIQARLRALTDKQMWAARGESLKGKAAATKEWFPSTPADPRQKAASQAKKAARNTPRRAS
jgi:hypothetical protein